ncbi:MAG: hypothetical protein ACI9TH_001136 [Kiritimatiellia bacterium]|jgi:hypothetical protein
MIVKNWYYTLIQMGIYVATFSAWKVFPSRLGFVLGGLAAFGLMMGLMRWAYQRGYFIGSTDLLIHLLIAVDLLVEGIMYEVYNLLMRLYGHEADAVFLIHAHNGFMLCASAFFILVVGYRFRRLTRT